MQRIFAVSGGKWKDKWVKFAGFSRFFLLYKWGEIGYTDFTATQWGADAPFLFITVWENGFIIGHIVQLSLKVLEIKPLLVYERNHIYE